jgi:hypothetical protein
MADVSIAWEKITRGLPRARRYADDRAPSIEEFKKICKYPDRSLYYGILRNPGVGLPHWRDIQPVERDGEIIAGRMDVYASEEDDSYVTFITPAAYRELSEWLKHYFVNVQCIITSSVLRYFFFFDPELIFQS